MLDQSLVREFFSRLLLFLRREHDQVIKWFAVPLTNADGVSRRLETIEQFLGLISHWEAIEPHSVDDHHRLGVRNQISGLKLPEVSLNSLSAEENIIWLEKVFHRLLVYIKLQLDEALEDLLPLFRQ